MCLCSPAVHGRSLRAKAAAPFRAPLSLAAIVAVAQRRGNAAEPRRSIMTVDHVNTLPISAPRYSARPFPPYRFVPGRHPHPSSPLGHSFRPPGEPEPPVAYHPPQDWRRSDDYLYGCDLYNHAYWWEAHEAWEGLWKLTPTDSAQRRYLQGIIQVSARHLQLFLGNLHGVERLGITAGEHLAAALRLAAQEPTAAEPVTSARRPLDEHSFMGLDLPRFRGAVEAYYAAALSPPAGQPPRHDPARYPYIWLR